MQMDLAQEGAFGGSIENQKASLNVHAIERGSGAANQILTIFSHPAKSLV
jgi:hypothetical protein